MDQNQTNELNNNVQAGYNPSDIYQAQAQQQFVPSQPTDPVYQQDANQAPIPPKKSPFGKIFAILIFLLVLLSLGGGAYYLYLNNPSLLGLGKNEIVELPENKTLQNLAEASNSSAVIASPTASVSASPSASLNAAFDFYDTTVWLNPELKWNKVSAGNIELDDELLAIESPTISFTTVQIQGTEWQVSYSSDQTLKFLETSSETKARLSALGWKESLEKESIVYSPLNVDTDERKVTSYIREQGNRIQIYAQLYSKSKATESAEIEQIEERVFLSQPIDINTLLTPLK